MIRLNAPKGLGDAIHVRAVVIHLLRQGELVTVFTRWPEVFADLDILACVRRTRLVSMMT